MLVVLWFSCRVCLQKILLVGRVSAKNLVKDFGRCLLWVKILDQTCISAQILLQGMGPKSSAILELFMELAKPLKC